MTDSPTAMSSIFLRSRQKRLSSLTRWFGRRFGYWWYPWPLHNPVANWMHLAAYRGWQRALGRPPILVLTVGKVGSTSVVSALRRVGIPHVVHLHAVTPDGAGYHRQRYLAERRRSGQPDLPVSRHVDHADHYGRWATRSLPHGQRWPLITLVRDPVARNLSSRFARFRGDAAQQLEAAGKLDEFVHESLLEQDRWTRSLDWFDQEVRPVFGLDLWSGPSLADRGHVVLENQRSRMLVLKLERLDQDGPAALREFLGLRDEPTLGRERRSADHPRGVAYRRFCRSFVLPADVAERVYGDPRLQHLYSAEEIAGMRERWSATPRD